MQQGSSMNKLDDRTQVVDPLVDGIAQPGAENKQDGPDALAAAGQDIVANIGNKADIRGEMGGDGVFDTLQIVRDEMRYFLY